jgi:hypothetical protein
MTTDESEQRASAKGSAKWGDDVGGVAGEVGGGVMSNSPMSGISSESDMGGEYEAAVGESAPQELDMVSKVGSMWGWLLSIGFIVIAGIIAFDKIRRAKSQSEAPESLETTETINTP